MSTINDSDLLLVERNGNLHQITYDQMSTLNDDDILLVERGGVQYKVEAQYVSTGANGLIVPPVEVLTPLNGSGITVFDQYEPLSSTITAVGEAGTIAKDTDDIHSVADESAWNESQVWSANVTNQHSTYTASQAFSGTISGSNIWGNNGSPSVLTLDSALDISGKTVVVYGGAMPGANQILINGKSITGWPTSTNSLTPLEITSQLSGDTTLTSIEVRATNAYFQGIEVDGKLLVDAIDDSQVWSSFGTGVYWGGRDWSKAFDGVISTSPNGHTFPNAGQTMTWTPSSPITVNESVVFYGINDTDNSTYGIKLNGGSNFVLPANSGVYGTPVTVSANDIGGSLSSISLICNASHYGPYLTAVEVDGKLLIDEGIRTRPTTGNKILTFPTNTNFSGLSVDDVVQSEYATWDSTTEGGVQSSTFSADNTTVTLSSGATTHVKSSIAFPTSGKWYVELTVNSFDYLIYGVIADSNDTNYPGYLHQKTESYLHYANYTDYFIGTNSGTVTGTIPTVSAGDVLGILLDLDNQELRFSINGTVHGGFNSVTNTVPLAVAISDHDTPGTASVALNAGQSTWAHEPPSGYLGLANRTTITAIDAAATPPSVTVDGGDWDTSNQSQVWSNGLSGSDHASYPIAQAFDGNLSTVAYAALGYTPIVTLPGGSITLNTASSLRVYASRYGATSTFFVNGNDYTSQISNSAGWYTITGETQITSIGIGNYNNGNDYTGLYAVEVNGKLLIDAGVRDFGDRKLTSSISYEKSLTFSDTTELANMVTPLEMVDSNGDVVTPVSDTIANVSNNVLTLQSNTNLQYFQPGDEVQTGVEIVSVDQNAPSITVDGGEWLGADGTNSAKRISRSLRFDSSSLSSYLSRTPSSAGNRRTWTWSSWLKRSKLSTGNQHIFDNGSGPYTGLYFSANDDLIFRHYSGGNVWILETDRKFRDTSSWYHVVVVYDSTQATASNRLAMYINGVKETSFSTETYPSPNYESNWNNSVVHQIATIAETGFFDGYLAEVHGIDGQALAPTDFGEFDSNGVWGAKSFSGTYGTNGFHLDFADNSSDAALGYDANSTYSVGNSGPWASGFSIGTVSSGDSHSTSGNSNTLNIDTAALGAYDITITKTGGANDIYLSTSDTNSGYNLLENNLTTVRITNTGTSSHTFSRWVQIAGSGGGNVTVTITGTANGTLTDNSWTVNNLTARSTWNQDYVWSDYWDAPMSSSSGRLNGFNGDTPSRSYADGTFSTWTSPVTLTVNTQLRIRSHTYTPGLAEDKKVFEVNGTNYYNLLPAYSSGTVPWVVIPETTLTSIKISGYGNGYEGSVLGGIEIDGVELVDQGISDPQAVNIDSLVDTPTNYGDDTGAGGEVRGNYPTWNPLDKGTITLSNGNLQTIEPAGVWNGARSTTGVSSGKWYWEVYLEAGSNCMVGISKHPAPLTSNYFAATTDGFGYNAGDGYKYNNSYSAYGATWTAGDTIGVAFDADSGTLTYYKNGTVQNSGTPAFTGITDGPYQPTIGNFSSTASVNFGQRPFAYAAPSGYKALCDTNLPSATIKDGSKHFDVVTYEGNSSTNVISGLGFSPDLVWIKNRTNGYSHCLFDTVRGTGKRLASDGAWEEDDYNLLNSFNSNGFTLGTTAGGGAYVQNTTGVESVAWCWNAGDNSNKTYNVTVVSGKYHFDGHANSAVTLDLEKGSTYIFDQSDSSNSGHPLRFGTSVNGTDYTTGVTYTGTPGTAGAKTTIVVASDAPTLYYSCGVHSGMGGQINTNNTAGATVLSGSLNESAYDQSQTWSNSATNPSSQPSIAISNGFDGKTEIGDITYAEYTGGAFPAKNVSFAIAVQSTDTIRIKVQSDLGPFLIDTGNGTVSYAAGSGSYWLDISSAFTSDVTNWKIGSAYNWNFSGLEINGKLLVDSGVSGLTSVPSINSVVRANQAAGFSIVSYTGNGGAASVAHGLNATPSFYIIKNRSSSIRWTAYHNSIGPNGNLFLNESGAVEANSGVNGTNGPDNNVFYMKTGYSEYNATGADYIAYCFAPVEGYSAMGSYTGNGQALGNMVYTGMKPRFILIKRTDSASSYGWWIWDTERNPHNPSAKTLLANTTGGEVENSATVIDVLSNGFIPNGTGSSFVNLSGATYIYMAFAENPVAQDAQVVTTGDTQVAIDALVAAATEIVETDGTTMYLNSATGPWRTGLSIEGSQINDAPPGPSEITFTSQNQGTPTFTGVDATLASRTWTLESSTTSTGPWTLVDTYSDFGVLNTQTGATPWTENKPTLQPNTYYRVKVAYNSTNADSVESVYNTFKTGDA